MTSPSLATQIDHVLATHHETEWLMLQELDAKISKLDDKRLVAPWRHLHDTLSSHMMKEEQVLFPAMRALEAGQQGMDFKCAIDAMQYEHELLGTFETAMRSAARDAGELEEPILALLDDLLVHAAFEDDVLFPAGIALREAKLEEPTCEEPAPAPRPKTQAPPPKAKSGLRAAAHGVRTKLKGILHL